MIPDWVETSKGDDFAAHASAVGRSIEVSLTGTADMTVASLLDQFLRKVHAEAQRRSAEEVTVDLQNVEFMNSSCLKSFVWWVCAVQEQTDREKYRIVIASNPSLGWQRRSLNALAGLATEVVSIRA
jgi:hypothetical protein